MSNVFLVAVGDALERRITALPNHRVVAIDRERAANLQSLLRAGESFLPDIIFIGNVVPLDHALAYAQGVQAEYPTIRIVLVGDPDAQLLLRAMRAGVRDVIPQSIGDDELQVMLLKAGGSKPVRTVTPRPESVPDSSDEGGVIVVASPKGGVGKSTVSANLAVALAGKDPMNTVLVDLDLQFGDAATLLNLQPTHTLADAFAGASHDILLLKTFLAVHPAGFYVLCGAESPAANDKVTSEQVRKLINQLAGQFRYVVIDTAAGIPEATLASLEEATDLVLISTMDVACVRSMRKEVDLLTQVGLVPPAQHLVLNFADRRSGLTVRDIEGVIGTPVDIVIPRSEDVPIAGNRGEPLMLKKKGGAVQKSIQALADRLSGPRRHHGLEIS